MKIDLKRARDRGELEIFVSEKEKTHPRASHAHFHAVVKSMSAGKKKEVKAASKRGPRGD